MNLSLKNLSIDQRLQIVEDIWDSIAAEQQSLPLTQEQKIELDRRLDAFELDGENGRLAEDVLAGIRQRL